MAQPLRTTVRLSGQSTLEYLDFSGTANAAAIPISTALAQEIPFPFQVYPEPFSHTLQERIAAYEGVPVGSVFTGNGSTEIIWLLLQALAPQEILFIGPVRGEYVRACHCLSIRYSFLATQPEDNFCISPSALKDIWNTQADLVVIGTPNDPTGVTQPNFHAIFSMLRSPRVLIDSSLRDFLYGTEDFAANSHTTYRQQLRPGVTLFTLHSFSHFFACPGLRLGYVLGERTQLDRVLRLRPSCMISPYAQILGELFLESCDLYRDSLEPLGEMVRTTGHALRRSGVFVPDLVFEGPSFLACRLVQPALVEKLCHDLALHRILVHNCDGTPGMPLGFVRIQAREEESVAQLAQALSMVDLRGA